MSTAAPLAPEGRLVSLDAYRGLTMLAMASGGLALHQVADKFPDSDLWQTIGYQSEHVDWVGCAAWDLIQPSFTFMVGVAMAYSCASRTRMANRTRGCLFTPWCAQSCSCSWASFYDRTVARKPTSPSRTC